MPQNKVPLKDLFQHLQAQMAATLTTSRKCIPHAGVKGDASEECWRAMLRKYLPKRYGVEKAFIVDSLDECSDQIDIVIFDQHYCPFLFNQDGVFYVPAESVYAVIEAKQEISKETIEYAAEKAASVRKLKRTNGVFSTASGPMNKNGIFDIPAGIVALSSGWNPHLGDAFELVIKEMAKLDNHRIDFGCAIEGGAFNIAYDDPKNPTIDKTHQEISLVTFLWNLVARLQLLGTAPAIEVPEYFKALG
jgi:hypothetical protein